MASERAARADTTFDRKTPIVPLQRVLDDSKPQPGAPRGARTGAVHSVKSFGDPRQMFLRDTDAGIRHGKDRAIVVGAPTDLDVAIDRRKSHGVTNEIVENRVQLGLTTQQR